MEHTSHTLATAFIGPRLLASGLLGTVALAVKTASDAPEPILVLDDRTGKPIDLDLRGSDEDILDRLAPPSSPPPQDADAPTEVRGRGRPRLGVVAREITLLPRHWEWLNEQPGGASVALRKLVEAARRAAPDRERQRQAQEAAYQAMSALAGQSRLPDFEEASRALFAADLDRLAELVSAWPRDIADHVQRLARDPGVATT
ncbi:MAG: DUF2239 family protein [Rubrivivax sp.]|nr:MAG: DUF2239 family protein [Rubrivivax sp.]